MPRLCKKSWLDSYMEFVSDSEAPDDYKYWCGVSALSTTLKRNVFVRRAKLKIYPNQYIVLVGPPGIGKGLAMTPAVKLVKDANVAHYIEDRATAERIQELLANGFTTVNASQGISMGLSHAATAMAPELSLMVGASDWSLQFFCTLWDKNEFTYSTKKAKDQVISDNCFGVLGGCTPDYIRKLNKDSMAAVAGGFTSRTIFSYANKKAKSVAWPDDVPHDLEPSLINDLRHINTLNGEFTWTPQARQIFSDFYLQNDSDVDDFESEVLINFRARLWSHVLKLAMCLSISESDKLEINELHINDSIAQIYRIFSSLNITFRSVGESDLVEASDRVMRFLEQKEKASFGEILRYNHRHITVEDLERVLHGLKLMHFCFEQILGKTAYYIYNPKFVGFGSKSGNKNTATTGTGAKSDNGTQQSNSGVVGKASGATNGGS